ncbi:MAG: hypothetical protein IID45_15275, partial [Planctomycetes bacterium]|nr:hypothetical protein [Planctomycetota bacterium]
MRQIFPIAVCCLMPSSIALAQPVAAKQQASVKRTPAAVARKPAANRERRIYVPFRNWQTLIAKDDPTVFLPYSEYLRLVKQAQRAAFRAPLAPPTGAVVTEAHYVGRIEAGRALLTCTLTVRSLTDGWSEVPLRFGNAAIGKFSGADGKAILRGVGNGRYVIMLPSKGTHRVTLNLTATVNTMQAGREFSIECPSVGISTFDLTVPEAGQTITILPGLTSLPVAAADKTSRVRMGLNASTKITARWFPKTAVQPRSEPLATVRNLIRVDVSKDLLLTDSQLTYEVHQGALREIRLAVPLSHRILDISSSVGRIVGWTDVKQATHRIVTFKLPAPVSGRLTIHVTTERTL